MKKMKDFCLRALSILYMICFYPLSSSADSPDSAGVYTIMLVMAIIFSIKGTDVFHIGEQTEQY